jgi:hypothetical protein
MSVSGFATSLGLDGGDVMATPPDATPGSRPGCRVLGRSAGPFSCPPTLRSHFIIRMTSSQEVCYVAAADLAGGPAAPEALR